jgi:hypothetical protein
MAQVHHLTISPTASSIEQGQTQSYTVRAYKSTTQFWMDVSQTATYKISANAGGSWQGNTYTPENATYGKRSITATLEVKTPVEPTFICPVCDLAFYTQAELDAHIAAVHLIVQGALATTCGQVAEYEDVTAFLYHPVGTPWIVYLHVESNDGVKDLTMPNNPRYDLQSLHFAVLSDRNTLWVFHSTVFRGSTTGAAIDKYIIGDNDITLASTLPIGDGNTRIHGLIRLASGKLLCAWKQHLIVNGSIPIGFAYTDNSQTWHIMPYISFPTVGGAQLALRCVICQHPDGTVWWFTKADSGHTIGIIRLVEVGESMNVDWVTDQWFIPWEYHEIEPDGELPYLYAVPSTTRNAIILGYQRWVDRITLNLPSIFAAAKPVFVKANSDGTPEMLFCLGKYTERVSMFDFGLDANDNIWVACNPVNLDTYYYGDLYLGDTNLGVSKKYVHSSKHLIADMPDGYIYLYSL